MTRFVGATFIITALLSGCNDKGADNTMSLLKSGAANVCAQEDVRNTVISLLRPDITNETENDRLMAIGDLSYTLELTTLEEVKKDVSKATCATQVTVSLGKESRGKFPVTFVISPSAEDPNNFVIETLTNAVTQASMALVNFHVGNSRRQAEAEAEAAEVAAQRANVLKVVNSKWIAGVWQSYSPDFDHDFSCSGFTGNKLILRADGVFQRYPRYGKFRVSGDQLMTLSRSSAGEAPEEETITIVEVDASNDSFTYTRENSDNRESWKRCPASWKPIDQNDEFIQEASESEEMMTTTNAM